MLHCALFVIHAVYPLNAQLCCLRSQQTAQTSQYISFNVSVLWTWTLCNIVPQVPPHHHFHTQHCISQTVWSDLKVALVLMHWDICMYIGYQQFGFWYLMEERLGFMFISLLSSKGLMYVITVGLTVVQFIEALNLKLKFREFESWWCFRNILSGRIVALGSTRHLTQMSSRDVTRG